MTQVQNTLSATNYTLQIQQQIGALVLKYIPGLGKVYNSVRYVSNPIVKDQAQIPCAMIQPLRDEPSMITTAKYHSFYSYKVFFMLADDDPDNLIVKLTDVGNIFQKLFSNNALGTLNNQFKQYSPYWLDSEMTPMDYSVPIVLGRSPGPKYYAIGDMNLRMQTVTLK